MIPMLAIAYVKKDSCNNLVGTKANLPTLSVDKLNFTTPEGGNNVIKTSSYIADQKSTMPSPIKKNYDYGEIPNWIDRVKYEEEQRKKRQSKINLILRKSDIQKFKTKPEQGIILRDGWISPEGDTYPIGRGEYHSSWVNSNKEWLKEKNMDLIPMVPNKILIIWMLIILKK